MCFTASVAIEGAAGSFDKLYGYLLPEKLYGKCAAGCRVTVPFGKGNALRQGMIFSLQKTEKSDCAGYKEIAALTDEKPVLTDEMLRLCEYLKERTFCTYFDAVHTMIPTGLGYRMHDFYTANPEFLTESLLSGPEAYIYAYLKKNGETSYKKLSAAFENAEELLLSLGEKQAVFHNTQPVRNMADLKKKYIRLTEISADSVKLTKRQKEVYSVLETVGEVSVKELEYFTGATSGVLDALCKKGVAAFFEKQEFRMPVSPQKKANRDEIQLSCEQQAAYDGLSGELEEAKVSLLYGITGSGKTQVYLKLVDTALEKGRGVIVMVPEIALTPQMINIFSVRYGDSVAVFHSGLSLGQRMDEYNRVRLGRAKVAIGTRSAVFAPFENLGLIIMDEEQEHTYRSEKSPRFHARDVAQFRAAYHKCLLCLASATPSLTAYSKAKSGRYGLYKLRHRYGSAVLPEVRLVDMKKELEEGNSSNISRELAVDIDRQLTAGKQIIILLNRRGHNTYVSCRDCGYVFECDECSISLTYHRANGRLMCHYCGKSIPVPHKCSQCGSENIVFSGAGTQKIEEELGLLFPKARILRLDADSTMTRDSYAVKLNAFANGEYDILLGTQMVAKGLDFPNVTLVGVIGADKALMSDDYRGFERTFSLLSQVVGRAGRSGDAGTAVIQTSEPQNHIIELAKAQDYDAFYDEEIQNRRLMIFPPFCDICVISAHSADRVLAQSAITEVFSNIKKLAMSDFSDIKLIILGPCAAAVPKVGGKYRYRMMIKCKNNSRFRELARKAADIKRVRDMSIVIDMNPETVI